MSYGAIMASGLYLLVLMPLTPSLLAHPYILVLLKGSASGMVTLGGMVRIGEASTGIGEQMGDAGAAIQRAREKTEEMQARASAMDELIASGTLEDYTSGDQTQLDRELQQLTTKSKVDDELAKMKAEIGAGSEQKELEQ